MVRTLVPSHKAIKIVKESSSSTPESASRIYYNLLSVSNGCAVGAELSVLLRYAEPCVVKRAVSVTLSCLNQTDINTDHAWDKSEENSGFVRYYQ